MSRKKKINTKYSPEFKIAVIMDMRENHLSYRETARKYNIGSNESQGKDRLRGWERIYLEEGAAGLMAERRGRKSTGRPRKQPLNKSMEEDLIAENQRLKERIEYLEAENEYIKKLSALVYAEEQKEREEAKIIAQLRQKYPLKILLKISCLPRSTFYYHLKGNKTDKYFADKQAIKEVFEENAQRYGYRRITDELHAKGMVINHKKVFRLMKMLGIRGKKRKNEAYHSYKGEVGKIADNLLNREFNAENAFEKLATDVTQFKVKDTKVYLSPIMDLYNNEIMSYSISLRPDLAQIREMLDGLSKKLPKGATPILHSDQGWQYQHAEYQRYLKEHNIVQSMSRKGNCIDNGAMECFFGRLKVEMFYGEKFASVEEFIQKLHEYIFYWNNKRISLKLKGMSPVQYRTHCQTI